MKWAGRLLKMIAAGSVLAGLSACAGAANPSGSSSGSDNPDTIGGGPASEMYKPVPLLWENQNKNGILWSAYVYQILGADLAPDLLPGTDDTSAFCPNYDHLNNSQKANFWAFLVSALSFYASDFNPVSSAIDVARGIDMVTGQQTLSEGLMQLSYADTQTYSFCAFNWSSDQSLSVSDIARSILDPFKNLDCGMKILATGIAATKKIASASAYWTILQPGSRGNQVAAIENLTATNLPFCTN